MQVPSLYKSLKLYEEKTVSQQLKIIEKLNQIGYFQKSVPKPQALIESNQKCDEFMKKVFGQGFDHTYFEQKESRQNLTQKNIEYSEIKPRVTETEIREQGTMVSTGRFKSPGIATEMKLKTKKRDLPAFLSGMISFDQAADNSNQTSSKKFKSFTPSVATATYMKVEEAKEQAVPDSMAANNSQYPSQTVNYAFEKYLKSSDSKRNQTAAKGRDSEKFAQEAQNFQSQKVDNSKIQDLNEQSSYRSSIHGVSAKAESAQLEQPNECSVRLYEEFMNCTSHPFVMQEREGSESMSSDGEFNDFKHFTLKNPDDYLFINCEYQRLLAVKYASQDFEVLQKFISGEENDHELMEEAKQSLQEKHKGDKYFSKRIVTDNREMIAPRWASDMPNLQKVSIQQQKDINPDAIFGRIDPRQNNVSLEKMFVPKNKRQFQKYNKERGSSAKQWNDTTEFATPNLIQKANTFKINHDNVQTITDFNPLLLNPLKQRSNTKVKGTLNSMQIFENIKIGHQMRQKSQMKQ